MQWSRSASGIGRAVVRVVGVHVQIREDRCAVLERRPLVHPAALAEAGVDLLERAGDRGEPALLGGREAAARDVVAKRAVLEQARGGRGGEGGLVGGVPEPRMLRARATRRAEPRRPHSRMRAPPMPARRRRRARRRTRPHRGAPPSARRCPWGCARAPARGPPRGRTAASAGGCAGSRPARARDPGSPRRASRGRAGPACPRSTIPRRSGCPSWRRAGTARRSRPGRSCTRRVDLGRRGSRLEGTSRRVRRSGPGSGRASDRAPGR